MALKSRALEFRTLEFRTLKFGALKFGAQGVDTSAVAMSVDPVADAVIVAYDAAFDQDVIDQVSRAVGWVRFVPVADFGSRAEELHPNVALANGPGLFLLEALEAGVPAVVPTCEESRRYVREGGGILTATDPVALADGIKRIVAMAPAARRVMGRIGRNHLLSLVS